MSGTFTARQRAYSERADPPHFAWVTNGPYFAELEARLLEGVRVAPDEKLLEIGCGEGGNLHHLGSRGALRFGVDFSREKAAFTRRHVGAAAVVADAAHLPFADSSFDVILLRDFLHHVPDPVRALAEARRVLAPGGRMTVIEPNARSPLVMLQAALIPAERRALRSTETELRRALEASGLRVVGQRVEQPLPLARVLLHPRLGTAQLGELPPVARALRTFDALAGRILPRRAWMYLVFEVTKA